jgi:hypothetical protein
MLEWISLGLVLAMEKTKSQVGRVEILIREDDEFQLRR